VLPPIIKPKGIDDVPILSLTLHGKDQDLTAFELERIAQNLEIDLKRIKGTREVTTLGGPSRAIQIEIDPARMQAAGITVPELRMTLQSAHLGSPVGDLLVDKQAIAIESGPFLSSAKDVADLVVGVRAGNPVFVKDIANVRDGGAQANTAVWHGTTGADAKERTAVTISVTKKPGENAIEVANAVLQQVDHLKHSKIPAATTAPPPTTKRKS
jgi:multidrug efflux pump subunit AcrB